MDDGVLKKHNYGFTPAFSQGVDHVIAPRDPSRHPSRHGPCSGCMRAFSMLLELMPYSHAFASLPESILLNDCLDKGISLNSDIVELLLRLGDKNSDLALMFRKRFSESE